MGLPLFFFASSWALGSWTYGHLAVHVLALSFHISGFFYLLFYLHQRGESVLTWFLCFDSGFGAVLELNNTLQLFG